VWSRTKWIFATLVFVLSCSCTAFAAEQTATGETKKGDANAAETTGILPIPNYGGDISNRSYLAGDLGGRRTEWAEKGVQFDLDSVQWADTVVDGGKSSDNDYGANLTYNLKVDLMRAGILPGALLVVRAESRFGHSANPNTGQIVPTNTAALSPTNYSDIDAGYDLSLTNLSYLQFLSERFGLVAGKLDLYADGDPNEFSGGRGRTQFMNWNLNFGTPTLFVPASTLGAGALYLPNKYLTLTSMLLSGTDCTNSNCFDDLDDQGKISATTATYQYRLGGLPGGVDGSFLYFFDQDFTDIDSISISLRAGLTGSDKNSSWLVGGSFWQYLSVNGTHEGPLDLTNRQPDLRGWGLFGRLYFADEDTNPWKTSASFGVGGRGVIPTRPNDVFGIGYFYADLSTPRFADVIGVKDSDKGYEAFYNLAITPAAKVSVNLQHIRSTLPEIDDSTLLSGRLQLIF
jgi:porin